jgi:hypothetical protein
MKKYLPLILLGIGLLVFVGVFFMLKSRNKRVEIPEADQSYLIELGDEEKPIVYLIPSPDGHYLKLKVENFDFGAASMDYLLLYTTKEIQQGVPGSFEISGHEFYEADLLLGSESSGKFRYDEGVEFGQIDIRFNDAEGNLIYNFSLPFHLQSGTTELTSTDDSFGYKLEDNPKGKFYVTMKNEGEPDSSKVLISKDGYSIFSSDKFVKKPTE